MARDKCKLYIPSIHVTYGRYIPNPARKIAIQVPIACASGPHGVDFLRSLKNNYGISIVFIPNNTEILVNAHLAGYKNEDLVIGVNCDSTPEQIEALLASLLTNTYNGKSDPTILHSINIDEPQNNGCKSDEDKNRIGRVHDVCRKYGVEFTIGNYDPWIGTNYCTEWAPYADSIVYSGYEYNALAADQSRNWRDLDSRKINGMPASGKRAWISLNKDRGEFVTLLKTASDLSFKEIWIFTKYTGLCYDEIVIIDGKKYLAPSLYACLDWARKYIEPFVQTAFIMGWMDREILDQHRSDAVLRCKYINCDLCDPGNPEDWIIDSGDLYVGIYD